MEEEGTTICLGLCSVGMEPAVAAAPSHIHDSAPTHHHHHLQHHHHHHSNPAHPPSASSVWHAGNGGGGGNFATLPHPNAASRLSVAPKHYQQHPPPYQYQVLQSFLLEGILVH